MTPPRKVYSTTEAPRRANVRGQASTAKDGSDMTHRSTESTRIAQLEAERDAAIAAYTRLDVCIHAIIELDTWCDETTTSDELRDRWTRTRAQAHSLVAGVDLEAAIERHLDRMVAA